MTLNPFAILGSVLRTVLPDALVAKLQGLSDAIEKLLQGETARVIGYGAGVVIYIVAKLFGAIPDVPFDQAVIQAGTAAGVLVAIIESIRHYVFSPATVASIVTTPPTAAGPIAAAEAVGVDTAKPGDPIDVAPDA